MKRLPLKFELLTFAAIIIIGLYIIFQPISISRDNSIVFHTTVYKVGEGSEGNIIFKLDQGEGTYFINHGLEKGLNLDTLQKELIYQKVTVLYLKSGFASGFSPVASTKHITELKMGNQVIYSEL